MDMFLFLWAAIATALYILEKHDHASTRYEYIEYRTKAEVHLVIENQTLYNIKSVRNNEKK